MFGLNPIKAKKEALEQDCRTIEAKQQELMIENKRLENSLNTFKANIEKARNEYIKILQVMKDTGMDIQEAEGIVEMQELGIEYTPVTTDLSELARSRNTIQKKIAKILGSDTAILTTRVYRIDGSEAKGRQFQKTYCENLLVSFNAYFEKKKKAVTANNYDKTVELLEKYFAKLNKKADLLGVSINDAYFNLCLDLLEIELEEKIAKKEERERIREEQRKLREQEKVLEEAEKERAELNKERRMYKSALDRALTDEEKQEFEAKLKEIDKREADIDYRVNNTRAGYLYIAATPSMPGRTKIGATRRLQPLKRIAELSTASVPYPFRCYGLVFSDDVFDLETKMHAYFDSKRTNKENKHKEFFNIKPKEAIDVLRNEFNCEVHFAQDNEGDDNNDPND